MTIQQKHLFKWGVTSTLSSFILGACQNFHFHALFAAGKSSLLISGFPAHLTSFPFHPSSLASNACHELRMRLLLVIWYILFCSPRTCVTNIESDLCLDLYFTHILFSCFRLTGHLVFSHFNWAVWISSFFFYFLHSGCRTGSTWWCHSFWGNWGGRVWTTCWAVAWGVQGPNGSLSSPQADGTHTRTWEGDW